MREGIIFIISGPSGGGKTTLVQKALKLVDNLEFSVSCTTRARREGETDGIDYRFVSQDEFRKMIKNGEFAEYAEVHDNLYGTPLAEFERARRSGVDLILDIDVQGARQIREKYESAVFCFVLPSSFGILKERLIKRQSDDKKDIEKRLTAARQEIEDIDYYDYIIVNDSLDEALTSITSVINAARCESERVMVRINKDYFS